MFLVNFYDGFLLGKRMVCLAILKFISIISIMMIKYIIFIIWKGGEVEGEIRGN